MSLNRWVSSLYESKVHQGSVRGPGEDQEVEVSRWGRRLGVEGGAALGLAMTAESSFVSAESEEVTVHPDFDEGQTVCDDGENDWTDGRGGDDCQCNNGNVAELGSAGSAPTSLISTITSVCNHSHPWYLLDISHSCDISKR